LLLLVMMDEDEKMICKNCDLIGEAHLSDVSWRVCLHDKFKLSFADGRTLDIEKEIVPPWCPLKMLTKEEEKEVDGFYITPLKKEIINLKDLEVVTKRNDATGMTTVYVTHKITGIQTKANEYVSMHKNKTLAVQRLYNQIIALEKGLKEKKRS